MKRVSLVSFFIALFLAPALLMGQSDNVSALIEKYQDNKKFTSVVVNPGSVKINAGEDEKHQKAAEMWENISKINILKIDEDEKVASEFYDEALKAIQKDGFSNMIQVNEDDESVGFYVKQGDKDIQECVLAVKDDDEYVLIQIVGIISFTDMMGIMDDIDINIDCH